MMRALVESWGKVLLALGLGIAVIMALLYGFNPLERLPSNETDAPAATRADGLNSNRDTRPSIDEADPKRSASDYLNGPMAEEKSPGGKPQGAAAPGSEAPPLAMVTAAEPNPPVEANARRVRIPAECWGLRGSAPRDYVVTLDREIRTSGEASALISSRHKTSGYTTMFQTSSAASVQGQRVEFSADVRTRDAKGSANLLLRAEDAYGNTVAFDNMQTSYNAERRPDQLVNTGVKGDSEWSTQHVVVDIPPEAAVITYGLSLFGEGKAWIDNARLEVVAAEVPTTAIDIRQSPTPPNGIPVNPAALKRSPRNLEFDLEAQADALPCN